MHIRDKILKSPANGKMLAVLIDPDRMGGETLEHCIDISVKSGVDFILAGGSILFSQVEDVIVKIKQRCSIPVVIFPGNAMQITDKADALLFISLISGRNPEYLIGHHVLSAPILKSLQIPTIPVGYILVENGRTTSVEYMSNTVPIPADKPEIVTATAIAGELLGLNVIYLEAGSGACQAVGLNIISEVRKNIHLPLIVGGGIKCGREAEQIYNAGADIIVTGTAVEQNPEIIKEFCKARDIFK